MDDFDGTIINRTLGMKLLDSGAEGSAIEMQNVEAYLQEGGVVHGGILTTLADSAAVYVLLPELPEGKHMTSIEFKMNFFRPAMGGAGPLRATATAVKRGRSVNVCEAEVFQAEKLLAKGTFTYLFYEA